MALSKAKNLATGFTSERELIDVTRLNAAAFANSWF